VAIETLNPATGETLRSFDELSDAALDTRLDRAIAAFRRYRRAPMADRASVLRRAADILEAERDAIGRLMATEMGKLAGAGRDEAVKCATGCRYYADHGAAMLADASIATGAAESFVRQEPLGVILAVMPWNFPFWQVFRVAAPALLAGNAVLLKHASNVPQCALLLEDVLWRAGLPDGVFQTLLVDVTHVPRLLADPRVAAVSLTGSELAGAEVASQAGRHLKKVVLELGGSDPFIVMPSADLDAAVETGVKSRLINNGQSCIAAKRFIVAESIADEFERRFAARLRTVRVGDPLHDRTELGPLARAGVRDSLHDQVRRSVDAGARVVVGGTPLDGRGFFYPPTLLADVPPASPAHRDELFGPVASLFRVPDLDAAIALANDTRFGLGCSIWTRDAAERVRCIEEIEAGQVFVNSMVASDPRLPFGGIKRSGYGRELGAWGVREFVNVKTVSIAGAPPVDRGNGANRPAGSGR
jgi:succinate-semialdehyde dehydrogenase / glutarate-semialdehyde dehydrogenase